MRLVCVSDIHGGAQNVAKLAREVKSGDVIIIAGDITNFGGAKEAKGILQQFLALSENVLAVPGNCDKKEVLDALRELGVNLHTESRTINGIAFFGLGGSNKTPFNTPQEYQEEQIEELLNKGYEKAKAHEAKVLVSHSPPQDTKIDQTRAGLHVGSKKVREFVLHSQPSLVISGHVHEARGSDSLGRSALINPGPFHMGCAVVELGGKISCRFVDF